MTLQVASDEENEANESHCLMLMPDEGEAQGTVKEVGARTTPSSHACWADRHWLHSARAYPPKNGGWLRRTNGTRTRGIVAAQIITQLLTSLSSHYGQRSSRPLLH